jgi:hypothetical protein
MLIDDKLSLVEPVSCAAWDESTDDIAEGENQRLH